MADPQLPVSAATADSEPNAIILPQLASSPESPPLNCCCGSLECIFLRHNNAVLGHVERDLNQAARMGQALLARHESYMADAERDRNELTTRIEQLETDNKELGVMNANMIEENRDLTDQLEALNTTITDSEAQVKSLEAALLSSQQTIRRLEAETARAEALERQIASLEDEQAELQSTLLLSREEARSAVSRWRRAERGLNNLQEQLERMEKEAKEEREQHAEMMNRIEKQREMEKELNTAAGRLKGAAAAKSLHQANGNGNGNGGSHVVGHFVRDLLQDNANLQYGIAELREMLMNSNDEIQALRDQLEYHRPLGDREGSSTTPTLRTELELEPKPPLSPEPWSPARISQELHIHHHYHHVTTAKTEARRPKKKRLGPVSSSGLSLPPAAASLPGTPPPPSGGLARQSSAPHSRRNSLRSNRWSSYSEQPSEFTLSSAPSSPRSNNRSSLFDPPMTTTGSFPGSPTSSVGPMSPEWLPAQQQHKRRPSNMSARSFQAPTCFPFGPAPPSIAHPIAEESSDGTEVPAELFLSAENSVAADDEASSSRGFDGAMAHDDHSLLSHGETTDPDSPLLLAGRRHRAMSHESIMSLAGGLDIHTLKSRPSQLSIRQPGSASSVTGSSIVTARPLLSRDSAKTSSALLRDYSFGAATSSPVGSLQSRLSTASSSDRHERSRLGKWVGWRPWGGGGGTSADGPPPRRSPSSSSSAQAAHKERDAAAAVRQVTSRPPGINQPGAIPGFSEFLAAAAAKKAPATKTTPDVVDREALREGLSE
ncbi:hypothetical protein F4802DRAFT_577157 [Xylaria palmicola]|nr:hypothetical protein F4802DRAFT_577157 [Xylaria palmicola]